MYVCSYVEQSRAVQRKAESEGLKGAQMETEMEVEVEVQRGAKSEGCACLDANVPSKKAVEGGKGRHAPWFVVSAKSHRGPRFNFSFAPITHLQHTWLNPLALGGVLLHHSCIARNLTLRGSRHAPLRAEAATATAAETATATGTATAPVVHQARNVWQ